MSKLPRAVLHVVQASRGESFVLEYDNEGCVNSNTVKFMLVDGGPARTDSVNTTPDICRPNHNLFNLLNWLSGDIPDNTPTNGLLKELDTVVLTVDDDGHKGGIQELFASILPKSHQDGNYGNVWMQGNRAVTIGRSPIRHIWYNSLKDVSIFQDKPVELNWFDKQLQQYTAMNLQPRVDSFNDDIANFDGENDKRTNRASLAMQGASSKGGANTNVSKGQFVISILGPSPNMLKSPSLLTHLSGPKEESPSTQGHQDKTTSKKRPLPGDLPTDALKTDAMNLETRINESVKSLSSISFMTVDKLNKKSLLFLSDGTAMMFFQEFLRNRDTIKEFTLMKVMHYGDSHNNRWPRDKTRKAEEDCLPVGRRIEGLSDMQRDVVFFFAKIRADKYLITTEDLQEGLNSVDTTIIGIIAAAYENRKSVEIYLTNPLPSSIVKSVGDFVHDKKIPDTIFRLYALVPGISWGTIAIYDHEKDYGWEQYDPQRDLWTAYLPWLKEKFPVLQGLSYNHSITPPHVTEYESVKTKTITDVGSILQHLVQQQVITTSQALQFQGAASTQSGFLLAPLVSLFIGLEESQRFLESLPFDLPKVPELATDPLVVNECVAEVIDSPSPELRGWRGIRSVSFKLSVPQVTPFSWMIPFGAASSSQTPKDYRIIHNNGITVSIDWPAYLKQRISGQFRGTLQCLEMGYPVVGEFTMLHQQPTRYTVQFSDAQYSADAYEIPVGDILNLFGCENFRFGQRLTKLLVPQLFKSNTGKTASDIRDQLEQIGETSPLNEGKFILEKVLSKVILKEVAATLRFDKAFEVVPFDSENLPLKASQLCFGLKDPFSVPLRRLTLQLDGTITRKPRESQPVAIFPLHLNVGPTLQGPILSELSLHPSERDPLTVEALLGIFNLSLDLSAAYPAVSNLSNALSISRAVIGWNKPPTPEYFTILTQIDDWNILEDRLLIKDITLDIQASKLSSSGPTQLSLQGRGALKILEEDVEVVFNAIRGVSEANDFFNFQMASQGGSVSLDEIASQLLGKGNALLPTNFNGLNEKSPKYLSAQAYRKGSGWTFSQMHIHTSIEGKLDIADQVDGASAALLINITYPFDKSCRTIYATLNTTIQIDSAPAKVDIVLASADDGNMVMAFTSDDQPITLQRILSHFTPGLQDLSLPPSLSFFLDLAIQKALVKIERKNKVTSITDMMINAVSTNGLQLWSEVTLEELSIQFSYSKILGKKLNLEGKLYVNNRGDALDFTLNHRPVPPPPGTTVTESTLEATAVYSPTLSTLDVISSLSGINIPQVFESANLSLLRNVLDIKMSEMVISLTQNSTATAFAFEAKTDWLFFSHLRFSGSKSASTWSYSFGFEVQNSTDFIKNIPVLELIASKVLITNPSLIIFNGGLNPQSLPPTLKLPRKINRVGNSVAFAAQIQLSDSLRTLGKATGVPNLTIIGIMSDSYIKISAGIDPVSLLKGRLVISGAIVMTCSEETNMAPRIGIEGRAVLDFGNKVSRTPIETSLALVVDTNTAGLGFEFTLDTWEGVFGYDGLDFRKVHFAATFPPEQFPVPSTFTVAGLVNLSVNTANFGGSFSIHGAETDPSGSYATGSIEGLDFNSILQAFSNAAPVSQNLNPGFGPLEFKIVPKDIVDYSGEILKQQFMMKGSMRLPQINFDANVQIGITMSRVVVKGHLAPIIALDRRLFSIVASSHEEPRPPAGSGATIYIAATDGNSQPECRISGQLTFLGASTDIYLDLSEEGLTFALERTWAVGGSLTGSVNSRILKLSGRINFTLEIILPSLQIGSIFFRDIRIIDFDAALHVEMLWSAVAWPLRISGHFNVFQVVLEKSFICDSGIQDLASLRQELTTHIMSTLAEDFVLGIKALMDQMGKVIMVLQQTKITPRDMAEFLIKSCGAAIPSVVKALQQTLHLGIEELVSIMYSIGDTASNVVSTLKQLNCEPYGMALAIAHVFGSDYKIFCGDLLMKEGYPVEDIARFFRDVFNESTLGVITLLGSLGFGPASAAKAISVLFGISERKAMILIIPIIVPVTQVQINVAMGKLLYSGVVKLHSHIVATKEESRHEESGTSTTADNGGELRDMIMLASKDAFQTKFGYEYQGPRTVPPSADTTVPIKGTDVMCSYEDGDIKKHTLEFVENIISNVHLTTGVEGLTKEALLEKVEALAQLPSSNEWQFQPLIATYSSPNEPPIQTSGLILYVNGLLFQNGQRVTQTVLFYIGVYYSALPAKQLARKQLKDSLYRKAENLIKPQSPIIDDKGLEAVLEEYANGIFEQEYRYMYDGWSIDLLKPETSFLHVRTYALGCFEDRNTDPVEAFVTNQIFSKISLPAIIMDSAKADILQLCRDITTMMDTFGEWIRMDYEHNFEGDGRSIRCKAIILRSSDAKMVESPEEKTTTSLSRLFFIGTFYEMPSPSSFISRGTIRSLCISLQENVKERQNGDMECTPQMLEGLLEQYSKKRFEQEFKFVYGGHDTKPPDSIPGEPVHGVRLFRAFQQASSKDIETWVEKGVLCGEKAPFARGPNRDNVLSELKRFLNKRTSAETPDNRWGILVFSETYEHPNDDNKLLKTAAIVLYANTLPAKEDTKAKTRFVHYLGMYYVTPNSPQDTPKSKSKVGAFFSGLRPKSRIMCCN